MKNAHSIIAIGALVSGLLAATSAIAQSEQSGTVARLKDVIGNVLVTQQAGLAAGTEAQRLTKGTRIITTANSEVVVVFDNDCEVRMRENQRLDIEDKPCAAMIPVSFGGTVLAAGAGAGLAGFITPIVMVGGAVVLLEAGHGRTPVSPN